MPIRMEEDSPEERRKREEHDKRQQERDQYTPQPQPTTNTGGGRGILNYLPYLLLFVFKKPKLLVPILLVGAAWFFFFGGKEMLIGDNTSNITNNTNVQNNQYTDDYFTFGATLSEERYDKAQVSEPLAYGYSKDYNQLPAKFSLLPYAPTRLHQGQQGSCVGWAAAYAGRTILNAIGTKKDPNTQPFSPSFLYNQIALTGCQGAYMMDAMQSLQQIGSVPFRQFRYDESTCRLQPSTQERQEASQYRIKGFNRLTQGANNYKPDMVGIRQHLAQGYPVVIGMQVGGTFMSRMVGQAMWQPTRTDYSMRGYGGHAMCVIGYDDNYQGQGAFQIMNSWGEDWGNRGVTWVTYRDFDYFVKEAYAMYPGSSDVAQDPDQINVKMGLVDNDTQTLLPLFQKDAITFRTKRPVQVGQKFKVAITNSSDCYMYVFGEETDGTGYVLFPYTAKHSPYCGTSGTRLFPKDHSMVADDKGSKDFIAVVVTKEPIDYNRLNDMINQSNGGTYTRKLEQVMREESIKHVEFSVTDSAIEFEGKLDAEKAVGMIIEIDKL